jgi:hypothetical protein
MPLDADLENSGATIGTIIIGTLEVGGTIGF